MCECYLKDICKKYKNKNCEYPEFCLRKFKEDKYFDLGLLSEAQRKPISLFLDADKKDMQAFDTLNKIKNSMCDFVNDGKNLYIFSSITGNGKTAWSLKLIQEYIHKIWYEKDLTCEFLFISVPRYLLSIKDAISNNNEYANHIKKNILSANLVVWDDIATKGMTEFETENILSVVDARINAQKANVFTSNILPQELSLYVGDRLASRIVGNSIQVQFFGNDKRILGRLNDGSIASIK